VLGFMQAQRVQVVGARVHAFARMFFSTSRRLGVIEVSNWTMIPPIDKIILLLSRFDLYGSSALS
jgi:hypothetical protein